VGIRGAAIVVLALLIDRWLGDPPNRFHPVAYMGHVIGWLERHAPRTRGQWHPFSYGTGLVIGGAWGMFHLGRLLDSVISRLPKPTGWLAEAVLLKMVISLSGLTRAASQICQALRMDDVREARRLVSWHLVSRDTSQLTASQVAAATIESLAENTSDGIIAPLFYYALGGLPAALAYRFVSTCDSMLGYHDPVHEWLGKASARLDDLLNLVPARLTAGLIVVAAHLNGAHARNAWHVWRRDARLTASPNAGHPMSAMAGALGVELEKVGHYRLGSGGRPPTPDDIQRAMRLVVKVAILAAGTLAALMWIVHGFGARRVR
jgi:adenosylcobinamide-phosphate synthase